MNSGSESLGMSEVEYDGLFCSSFSKHLNYKLSMGEVDDLSKRKWKYKWELQASNMSKWIGTRGDFLNDGDMNSDYGLKRRLYEHFLDIYKESRGGDFHSSKQRLFFSLCNSYRDILHHSKEPFYLKGMEEDSSIMDAYIMHSLNHIFRTRDLVTKNDARVAKHQDSWKDEIFNSVGLLDHGFTRPKVLILLPLASIVLRVVKRLIELTPSKYKINVEHIDRFFDEFGSTGIEDKVDGDDVETSEFQKSTKPFDFQALFGANNNDHFMLGIKFTRKLARLK